VDATDTSRSLLRRPHRPLQRLTTLGRLPTAHTKGDIGDRPGWADTHDLIPRLEFESGEKIYLYAWDGSAGANMGPFADGVTSEHYGGIADDPTFNLKRISPTGETLDNHTVRSRRRNLLRRHPAAVDTNTTTRRPQVPDGYYLVSVQGQRHAGLRDQRLVRATDVLTTDAAKGRTN